MKRYAGVKEELESELYSRFVLVLNEKKAKIRSLQEAVTRLQETRYTGHINWMLQPFSSSFNPANRHKVGRYAGYISTSLPCFKLVCKLQIFQRGAHVRY